MTIEWTDEAVNAAITARFRTIGGEDDEMRAALDAAVKAQGVKSFSEAGYSAGYSDGLFAARAEALEEAAAYMEKTLPHLSLQEYAAAIRALIEPEVKK